MFRVTTVQLEFHQAFRIRWVGFDRYLPRRKILAGCFSQLGARGLMKRSTSTFAQVIFSSIVVGLLAVLVTGGETIGQDNAQVERKSRELIQFVERIFADVRGLEDEIKVAKATYLSLREKFLKDAKELRIRAPKPQSDREKLADEYFGYLRRQSVLQYQGQREWNQSAFPPANPFPLVRDQITLSPEFSLIQKMPKGGLLHVHSTAAGRASWVVQNLPKFPGCYVFWGEENKAKYGSPLKGQINFFAPSATIPQGYLSIDVAKQKIPDLDAQLLSMFVVGRGDCNSPNPWDKFGRIFQLLGGFVQHQPAFVAYFEDAMRTLIADGIDYVEMRTGAGEITDLGGLKYDKIEQYKIVRDNIRNDHPDFDMKLIIADYRGLSINDVRLSMQRVLDLREAHPDFVIGYDLVGQETQTTESKLLLDALLQTRSEANARKIELPLFFHDGETDWADNDDLVDAVLIGTRRIGHGFNLFAFPTVEAQIRSQKIALEVCPISNQMLRYVSDLRIHPACGYIRRGVPCVLASDDPLILQNDGLSYDFWTAWMAWSLQLQDLKALAHNSIIYSGMSSTQKSQSLDSWNRKWDQYVDWIATQANQDSGFLASRK